MTTNQKITNGGLTAIVAILILFTLTGNTVAEFLFVAYYWFGAVTGLIVGGSFILYTNVVNTDVYIKGNSKEARQKSHNDMKTAVESFKITNAMQIVRYMFIIAVSFTLYTTGHFVLLVVYLATSAFILYSVKRLRLFLMEIDKC